MKNFVNYLYVDFGFKIIGKLYMIKKIHKIPPTHSEDHVRGNKLFKGWP